EIHAPVVYDPARHIPYATLTEATAAHTATATAASKAFNIPGLKCAQLILTDAEDRAVWQKKGQFVSGAASNPGIIATTAAYTHGGDWLAEVTAYLKGNRDHLTDLVTELLPNATYIPPEGTYLAWLDLRGYGLEGHLAQRCNERAKVAITEGRLCGAGGAGHIRFHFALPRPLLTEAVERIARTLRGSSDRGGGPRRGRRLGRRSARSAEAPRAQLSAAETAGDVLQAITHPSCGLGNRVPDGVEATSVFGEDVIAGDIGEA